MIYGYCRVSTPKQNIERQIRNIRLAYPSAVIYKEAYTGTTIERKQLDNLLKVAKNGDIIVFDSVSRMSRNAAEGIELYQRLFDSGIELVFIKEPHINTLTYKRALSNNIPLTGTKTDIILNAVNQYLMELAKEQIELAFEQAQKEVDDLHERTKEGIQKNIPKISPVLCPTWTLSSWLTFREMPTISIKRSYTPSGSGRGYSGGGCLSGDIKHLDLAC